MGKAEVSSSEFATDILAEYLFLRGFEKIKSLSSWSRSERCYIKVQEIAKYTW